MLKWALVVGVIIGLADGIKEWPMDFKSPQEPEYPVKVVSQEPLIYKFILPDSPTDNIKKEESRWLETESDLVGNSRSTESVRKRRCHNQRERHLQMKRSTPSVEEKMHIEKTTEIVEVAPISSSIDDLIPAEPPYNYILLNHVDRPSIHLGNKRSLQDDDKAGADIAVTHKNHVTPREAPYGPIENQKEPGDSEEEYKIVDMSQTTGKDYETLKKYLSTIHEKQLESHKRYQEEMEADRKNYQNQESPNYFPPKNPQWGNNEREAYPSGHGESYIHEEELKIPSYHSGILNRHGRPEISDNSQSYASPMENMPADIEKYMDPKKLYMEALRSLMKNQTTPEESKAGYFNDRQILAELDSGNNKTIVKDVPYRGERSHDTDGVVESKIKNYFQTQNIPELHAGDKNTQHSLHENVGPNLGTEINQNQAVSDQPNLLVLNQPNSPVVNPFYVAQTQQNNHNLPQGSSYVPNLHNLVPNHNLPVVNPAYVVNPQLINSGYPQNTQNTGIHHNLPMVNPTYMVNHNQLAGNPGFVANAQINHAAYGANSQLSPAFLNNPQNIGIHQNSQVVNPAYVATPQNVQNPQSPLVNPAFVNNPMNVGLQNNHNLPMVNSAYVANLPNNHPSPSTVSNHNLPLVNPAFVDNPMYLGSNHANAQSTGAQNTNSQAPKLDMESQKSTVVNSSNSLSGQNNNEGVQRDHNSRMVHFADTPLNMGVKLNNSVENSSKLNTAAKKHRLLPHPSKLHTGKIGLKKEENNSENNKEIQNMKPPELARESKPEVNNNQQILMPSGIDQVSEQTEGENKYDQASDLSNIENPNNYKEEVKPSTTKNENEPNPVINPKHFPMRIFPKEVNKPEANHKRIQNLKSTNQNKPNSEALRKNLEISGPQLNERENIEPTNPRISSYSPKLKGTPSKSYNIPEPKNRPNDNLPLPSTEVFINRNEPKLNTQNIETSPELNPKTINNKQTTNYHQEPIAKSIDNVAESNERRNEGNISNVTFNSYKYEPSSIEVTSENNFENVPTVENIGKIPNHKSRLSQSLKTTGVSSPTSKKHGSTTNIQSIPHIKSSGVNSEIDSEPSQKIKNFKIENLSRIGQLKSKKLNQNTKPSESPSEPNLELSANGPVIRQEAHLTPKESEFYKEPSATSLSMESIQHRILKSGIEPEIIATPVVPVMVHHSNQNEPVILKTFKDVKIEGKPAKLSMVQETSLQNDNRPFVPKTQLSHYNSGGIQPYSRISDTHIQEDAEYISSLKQKNPQIESPIAERREQIQFSNSEPHNLDGSKKNQNYPMTYSATNEEEHFQDNSQRTDIQDEVSGFKVIQETTSEIVKTQRKKTSSMKKSSTIPMPVQEFIEYVSKMKPNVTPLPSTTEPIQEIYPEQDVGRSQPDQTLKTKKELFLPIQEQEKLEVLSTTEENLESSSAKHEKVKEAIKLAIDTLRKKRLERVHVLTTTTQKSTTEEVYENDRKKEVKTSTGTLNQKISKKSEISTRNGDKEVLKNTGRSPQTAEEPLNKAVANEILELKKTYLDNLPENMLNGENRFNNQNMTGTGDNKNVMPEREDKKFPIRFLNQNIKTDKNYQVEEDYPGIASTTTDKEQGSVIVGKDSTNSEEERIKNIVSLIRSMSLKNESETEKEKESDKGNQEPTIENKGTRTVAEGGTLRKYQENTTVTTISQKDKYGKSEENLEKNSTNLRNTDILKATKLASLDRIIEELKKIIAPFDPKSPQRKVIFIDPNSFSNKAVEVIDIPGKMKTKPNVPEFDPFENDELAKSSPDTESLENYNENYEEDYTDEDSSDEETDGAVAKKLKIEAGKNNKEKPKIKLPNIKERIKWSKFSKSRNIQNFKLNQSDSSKPDLSPLQQKLALRKEERRLATDARIQALKELSKTTAQGPKDTKEKVNPPAEQNIKQNNGPSEVSVHISNSHDKEFKSDREIEKETIAEIKQISEKPTLIRKRSCSCGSVNGIMIGDKCSCDLKNLPKEHYIKDTENKFSKDHNDKVFKDIQTRIANQRKAFNENKNVNNNKEAAMLEKSTPPSKSSLCKDCSSESFESREAKLSDKHESCGCGHSEIKIVKVSSDKLRAMKEKESCSCSKDSGCSHNEILKATASPKDDTNKYDILNNLLLWLKQYAPKEQ